MAASGHRAPHSRHLQQVVQSNAVPDTYTVQQSADKDKEQQGHLTAEHATSIEVQSDAAGALDSSRQRPSRRDEDVQPRINPSAGNGRLASAPIEKGTSGISLIVPLLGAAAVAAAVLLWRHISNSKGSSSKGRKASTGAGSKAAAKGKSGSKDARGKKRAKQGDVTREDDQHAAQQGTADQEPETEPEPVLPDTLEIVVAPVQLLPPPNPLPPAAPLPLNNLTFVVSEDIEVEGNATSFGVTEWQAHYSSATGTAPAVARAVSAGATCTGKTAVQQAGLDFVGINFGNLFNKTRVAGGGCTGAAVQMAQQAASFALCSDSMGEMRVAAACNGVLGYRPTPGAFGGATASSQPPNTGGFGTASIMCRDPSLMLKVAQALGAPGTANIKGEVMQFVVAQDLCDMCAPELQPAILALKKAILKYAGSDQAGAVQFVRFLASHVRMYTELLPGTELAKGYAPPEGTGIRVDDFLEASLVACSILRAEELHQRAGALQQAAAPAVMPQPASDNKNATDSIAAAAHMPASDKEKATDNDAADSVAKTDGAVGGDGTEQDASTAAAAAPGNQGSLGAAGDSASTPQDGASTKASGDVKGGDSHQGPGSDSKVAGPASGAGDQQQQQQQQSDSKPEAAIAPEGPPPSQILPPRPTAEQLAVAKRMASGVMECLRGTVKPDTIMVLPALPFPPPKRQGADGMELTMWTKLTQCFNALASLAACPTLTAPVGHLRDGSPVAISLMAVHRFDQRLLAVAQKLCPMIQDSFQAVKEEITNMARQKVRDETVEKGMASASPGSPPGMGSPAAPSTPPRANGATSAHGSAGNMQQQQQQSSQSPPQPHVDPKKLEKADKAKAKGNELYLAGKYLEALNEYTKAISLVPSSHVYYSNRAMACIKLFRFEQAEEDCNRTLTFELSDKDKVKALLRRATARDALQKYEGAEQDLKAVLRLEPNNKQAREDLQALRRHQAQMAESTAQMVAQMRAQAAAAAGSGSAGPTMQLPPGMDPSMFPPGFDPSMLPPGLFGPDGQMMLGGQMGGYEPVDGFTM